jgi:hypothetical protein
MTTRSLPLVSAWGYGGRFMTNGTKLFGLASDQEYVVQRVAIHRLRNPKSSQPAALTREWQIESFDLYQEAYRPFLYLKYLF